MLASVQVDRSPYGSRLPSEPICGSPSSLPCSGEFNTDGDINPSSTGRMPRRDSNPCARYPVHTLAPSFSFAHRAKLTWWGRNDTHHVAGFRHHKFQRIGYRMYGPYHPPARISGGAVLGFTGQEEKNPTAAASAIPRPWSKARHNLLVGLIFGYVGERVNLFCVYPPPRQRKGRRGRPRLPTRNR